VLTVMPARGTVLVEDCAQRAYSDVRGLKALSGECPGLETAIHDLKLDAQLPGDWQQHLSSQALSDWTALSSRYAGTLPVSLPDPGSLREIARRLPPPKSRPTLWEAISAWVRSWLVAHRAWWPDWGRYLSGWHPTALQVGVMLYSVIALVVLSAAAIVVIEMRAAGLFGPGRRFTRRPGIRFSAPEETPIEPADIGAVPPRLRAVLLLRSLVAVLTRSQRLAHERDLTCRELITAARFDTGQQRERFAAVALLAEASLYGPPEQAPPPEQDVVLAEAQGLKGQLLPAGSGRR
jgi:hypothetical protein